MNIINRSTGFIHLSTAVLAFVPSWISVLLQGIQLVLLIVFAEFRDYLNLEILVIVVLVIFCFGLKNTTVNKAIE